MDLAASNEQRVLPFSDLGFVRSEHAAVRKLSRKVDRRRPVEPAIMGALSDPSRVLFLDIETTGLSRYYDELTLVGWLLDRTYRVHIRGDDPNPLFLAMLSASAIVTFNGTLFDLPFLAKEYPALQPPQTHVDLRFLARRVGLTGGQKAIEHRLGIKVRHGVEDVDGAHAVLLWHRYLRGDNDSLARLIDYNRSDVIGMRHILDEALDRLVLERDFWTTERKFSDGPISRSGWAVPGITLPSAQRLGRIANTFQTTLTETPGTIIGIDLTGSEARPSGWCVLRGAHAETHMIKSDDEMIARAISASPALVSIDSPLSMPFGRTRVGDDDPTREEFGIMRRCERELKRRGINVYPCLLPSMQALTRRGIRLAERFRRHGIPVIESYPGAAQDIMGIPRKGAGEELLKQGLVDFGISGDFVNSAVRHDELDAITSALVGSFFLAGKYEALSGPAEDPLIIPDLEAEPGPVVVGISGRISAGKTTAARFLQSAGFAYTRFSLVLDDELKQRGLQPSRESRQKMGLEINQGLGQRWLCQRALELVGDAPMIVIDGLRFLEDRAFFVERFGSRFLQLHIYADRTIRKTRYEAEVDNDLPFEEADVDPVEAEIDELGQITAYSIENSSTVDALRQAVEDCVQELLRAVGKQCRSRLS